MLRVDFYSLQEDDSNGDIVEKVVSSQIEASDHVEILDSGERIDEPYETFDGVQHDPNADPRDYLENLYRYYHGTYFWASRAYEENDDMQAGGLESASPSPVYFTKAYFIKLGRGGEWETDSINTGKLRLGWKHQSVDDINEGRWSLIKQQLRENDNGARTAATTSDFNALRNLASSGPEDIWITFHQGKLWWAHLAPGLVQQDEISKFRLTSTSWSDKAANERLLVVSSLPGKITQIQGFRGTVCRVRCPELLRRILNGIPSPLASSIADHRSVLACDLAAAIKELHWKDFETIVDLVFRSGGWVRESILGQQEKGYDLLLRAPITGERCVVQVKSRAGMSNLQDTIASFSSSDFRRIFFVVHSPDNDLAIAANTLLENIRVVGPQQLGELALDAGLSKWLQDKCS